MIVGLTGGIGSGKSIVAKLFELLGCRLFNSDDVAKQLYFEEEIKQKIINLLGNEAYLTSCTLNKTFISSKIFADKILLQKLNAVIHPAVLFKFNLFVNSHPNEIIIKESALLFEANLNNQVNKIILVVANDEIRINRTIHRDGITREQVLKKINSQLNQSEKIIQSHFIIHNNETELLIPQVLKVYGELLL